MTAILFSDDFESGSFSGSKWSYANAKWTVQNVTKHAGTYAAKGVSNGQAWLISNTISNTNGKIYINLYARTSNTTGSVQMCCNVTPNYGYINALKMESGHFKYVDKDLNTLNLPTDKTYTYDTWYHIIITLDFTNSKLSWTIDDTSYGTVDLPDCSNGVVLDGNSYVDTIEFVTSTGATGEILYIDDLSVERDSTNYTLSITSNETLVSPTNVTLKAIKHIDITPFLLQDNFETNNLNPETWYCIGQNTYIQSGVYHNGGYSLELDSGVTDPVIATVNYVVSGKIELDFYANISSLANPEIPLFSFYLTTDMGCCIPLWLSNGYFKYSNINDTHTNLPVTTTYTANTWYHIVLVLDFNKSKMSWTIDGNYKGETDLVDRTNHSIITKSKYLRELIFQAGTSGPNIFIDDLSAELKNTVECDTTTAINMSRTYITPINSCNTVANCNILVKSDRFVSVNTTSITINTTPLTIKYAPNLSISVNVSTTSMQNISLLRTGTIAVGPPASVSITSPNLVLYRTICTKIEATPTNVLLEFNRVIAISSISTDISTQSISLRKTNIVTISNVETLINYTNVSIKLNRLNVIETQTTAISPTDVLIKYGRELNIESNSINATSSTISLEYGPAIDIDNNAISINTSTIYVNRGYAIDVDVVNISLNLTDVSIKQTRFVTINSNTITISTTDVLLKYGKAIDIDNTSVSTTTENVLLKYGHKILLTDTATTFGETSIAFKRTYINDTSSISTIVNTSTITLYKYSKIPIVVNATVITPTDVYVKHGHKLSIDSQNVATSCIGIEINYGTKISIGNISTTTLNTNASLYYNRVSYISSTSTVLDTSLVTLGYLGLIDIASANVAVNPTPVTIRCTRILPITSVPTLINAQDVGTTHRYDIYPSSTTTTITGQSINFTKTKVLLIENSAIDIICNEINKIYNYKLSCDTVPTIIAFQNAEKRISYVINMNLIVYDHVDV